MSRLLALLWMSAALSAAPAAAEVYKYVDENGRTHFTDRPPDKAKAELLELKVNTYGGTPVVEAHSAALRSLGGSKVTLYGTRSCGACKLARKWMRNNKVSYSDLDIETNAAAQREYLAMGLTGVPVIVVGRQRMLGFDAGKLGEMIKSVR